MRLQPAPLQTQITMLDKLTQPWSVWFRNLSKNMEQACTNTSENGVIFNINNNILSIQYSGNNTESFNISLPILPAYDTFLNYYKKDGEIWSTYILDVPKDSSEISIPAGNIRLSGSIIVNQQNR